MSEPAETSDFAVDAFVSRVFEAGRALYRDLPWRDTRDPYAVLVSEVMLQQTQVSRVVSYWHRWMADFPDLEALAAAPLEAVLLDWQGLGYNRRAIALKRLAETVVEAYEAAGTGGPAQLPSDTRELVALPGVGPATAAGIRAFAYDLPSAYLETNVRAVVLHELFAEVDGVTDRELTPIVERAATRAADAGISARDWNYALLDYGAHLKKSVPNPSRRSAHHSRQSTFEGSHRQKRARLLRAVLASPGMRACEYAEGWLEPHLAEEILAELQRDGFVRREGYGWSIA